MATSHLETARRERGHVIQKRLSELTCSDACQMEDSQLDAQHMATASLLNQTAAAADDESQKADHNAASLKLMNAVISDKISL